MAPKKQRGKKDRTQHKNETVKENVRPSPVGSPDHVKVLNKHQLVLERCTHINIQVITCLRAKKVIGNKLEAALIADNDLVKRNQRCYNHLKKQSTDIFNRFILEMEENEQKHVARLLKENKEGQLPMSSSNYDRLINIRPILMKDVFDKGCKLASAIRSKRESDDTDFAISEVELEEIQQERRIRERNYFLISAVLRRTDYSFECLREALIENDHGHLVKYMNEGVIVGTRVETTHPGSDETLVKSFNEQLHLLSSEQLPSDDERPVREAFRDLSNRNIPFVAAESGSIMLYTYCRTTDDIRTFVEMFRSRQLHSKISDIFERLFKMSRPQSLDTFHVKGVTITEEYKEIIEQFTGIADFSEADVDVDKSLGTVASQEGGISPSKDYSATDVDVDKPLGTVASQEGAISPSKDYSATDVDVDKPLGTVASQEDGISPSKDYSATDVDVEKSLGAAILHEDANIISNDYSAAATDVKRSLGTDSSKEDATKTSNARRESTIGKAYHTPMPKGEDLFLTKHSATQFQNVHAPLDAMQRNPESMVATTLQLYNTPTQKRRQVTPHSPPSTKIRKKELGTFSRWTKTSNARKSLPIKSKQSPAKRLKGRIKPKKPKTKQKLVGKGLIKGKFAFPRSISSTPHCKAYDEPERGMTPRNRRSLSY